MARLGRDNVVSSPDLAHHSIGHGGHARSKGAAGLGPLDQRHALLEDVDGGIGEAGIVVTARDLVLEQQLGMFGTGIGIARIEKDGFAGLVERRALAPAMDHLGGRAMPFRIKEGVLISGHFTPSKTKKTGTHRGGRFQTVFSTCFFEPISNPLCSPSDAIFSASDAHVLKARCASVLEDPAT
ncbi:hypothetical protein D3C72_1348850 [compost metagenome]